MEKEEDKEKEKTRHEMLRGFQYIDIEDPLRGLSRKSCQDILSRDPTLRFCS